MQSWCDHGDQMQYNKIVRLRFLLLQATSATDPISFNTAFARFLSMLRQDWTQPMQEWAKSKMEVSSQLE